MDPSTQFLLSRANSERDSAPPAASSDSLG
jgi:hypothetical protein